MNKYPPTSSAPSPTQQATLISIISNLIDALDECHTVVDKLKSMIGTIDGHFPAPERLFFASASATSLISRLNEQCARLDARL